MKMQILNAIYTQPNMAYLILIRGAFPIYIAKIGDQQTQEDKFEGSWHELGSTK